MYPIRRYRFGPGPNWVHVQFPVTGTIIDSRADELAGRAHVRAAALSWPVTRQLISFEEPIGLELLQHGLPLMSSMY